MDVIASTAFGLHIDSQKNENDPFAKYAAELLEIYLINSWMINVASQRFHTFLRFALSCFKVEERISHVLMRRPTLSYFEKLKRKMYKTIHFKKAYCIRNLFEDLVD